MILLFTYIDGAEGKGRWKALYARTAILITLLVINVHTHAQISAGGNPRVHSASALKSTVVVPVFSAMPIDAERLLEEDAQSPVPWRFSIFEEVAIDIKEQGAKFDLPKENGRLWIYNIESRDARSVQLFFKEFLLPDGAELFIYNQDLSIIRGAFTSANNKQDMQLMLADFADNNITIEYFEPDEAAFEGLLELGSVGLAYKEFAGKKSLEDTFGYLNVNTAEGEKWQDEKHSVCRISFRRDDAGYICSGGLLNNALSDGTPYFLTANHCIDNNIVARSVVAYFNYEIYGGSGEISDTNGLSLSGAKLLKSSADTDFTLLLLNETPNAAYQPYYAPWNATSSQESSAVGIHHPNGWPKRISISQQTPFSYDQYIQWEGGRTTPPDTHWGVIYDHGKTSGGSSGSPLFNSEKQQVIGQLHGGSAVDYYGKFNVSYQYNSRGTISQYLDPNGEGLDQLETGYYPPTTLPDPQLFPAFKKVCKGVPVQLTGMSAFDPISWSWSFSPASVTFTNGTDSNSKEPYVRFNESGSYGVTLEVSNAAGSKTRWFPESIIVGDDLSLKIQPYAIEDSCLLNFDSISLEAGGAEDYLWQFSNADETHFYFVNDTLNPVTIKMNSAPGASRDLSLRLLGSHGTCSQELSYSMLLTQQNNDSIKNAIQIFAGESVLFSNKCAGIEENEPIPPITSCTGNSWCDEFGTGEDIIGNSVWFYFIPEESRQYRIASSGMDNQIAVYNAESVEALLGGDYELMIANDDFSASDPNPVVYANLIAGEKYLIQVDGSAGNVSGDFVFNIRLINGTEAVSTSPQKVIKIYPQPLGEFFYAECKDFNNPGLILAEVFDVSGTLIQTSRFDHPTGNVIEINADFWQRGVYFIRFRVENMVYVEKVIKN